MHNMREELVDWLDDVDVEVDGKGGTQIMARPSPSLTPTINATMQQYPVVAFHSARPPQRQSNTVAIAAALVGVMVMMLGFAAVVVSVFVLRQ